MQHERAQYIKRLQQKKVHEGKIATQKDATWKWCSMNIESAI